jgi:ABC-2 type transport system permease protein
MFVLLDLIFSVAFGLRDEEVWGTSRRLAMAPVSHRAVIGGKLLARVIVGTIQLLSLLLFGHLMYGVPLGESLGTLFLLTVAVVASMGCFSLLVAAVARSPEQIVPVGLTAVFILAAIGGCWWPFFEQPRWMQTLGEGMLTTWSMRALQDVLLRGKGLLEITPELLVLVAYGLVSLGVGLRVFRYAET